MGVLRIDLNGSFEQYEDLRIGHPVAFPAMGHGHAQAVAEAIAWLSGHLLPRAIVMDHRLQSEGATPEHGFGRT